MAFLINNYLKERKYVIISESLCNSSNRLSYIVKSNNIFVCYSPTWLHNESSLNDYCINQNIKLTVDSILEKDRCSGFEMLFDFEEAKYEINNACLVRTRRRALWLNEMELIVPEYFKYYIKEFQNG